MSFNSKSQITQTVQELKLNNQDFEFYPTTKEMLDVIKKDLLSSFITTKKKKLFKSEEYETGLFLSRNIKNNEIKIIDIGAGNGDSLNYLAKFLNGTVFSDLFYYGYNDKNTVEYDNLLHGNRELPSISKLAIEKSFILTQSYKKDKIHLISSDYDENFYIGNNDIIFCNPPYSNYRSWLLKTLANAMNSPLIYFIIPSNWKNDKYLQEELNLNWKNKFKFDVLDTFDFNNANRAARVQVDIVRIEAIENLDPKYDFVKSLFDTNELKQCKEKTKQINNEINNCLTLKNEQDFASSLVNSYNNEMKLLQNALVSLSHVPIDNLSLLLNLDYAEIQKRYQILINTLNSKYWDIIVNKTSSVKKKLIKEYSDKIMNQITDTNMEFTLSNIYMVISKLLYTINDNMNKQVLTVYNDLIKNSPTEKYKSNYNFFVNQKTEIKDTRCKLTQRVILEMGFFSKAIEVDYNGKPKNKLTENTSNRILDLIIVIESLGYKTDFDPKTLYCERGVTYKVEGVQLVTNKDINLFEFKVFLNGNIHIKMNETILQKLNIIKGLLEGWIVNTNEIMEEFDVNEEVALEMVNIKLNGFNDKKSLLIGFN